MRRTSGIEAHNCTRLASEFFEFDPHTRHFVCINFDQNGETRRSEMFEVPGRINKVDRLDNRRGGKELPIYWPLWYCIRLPPGTYLFWIGLKRAP